MAARTRWRCRLTVAGRDFLWYVADDIDAQGPVLHLFAADKSLALTYFLEGVTHHTGRPALIVAERGAVMAPPAPPTWAARSIATPAFVREVAEWALASVITGGETPRTSCGQGAGRVSS